MKTIKTNKYSKAVHCVGVSCTMNGKIFPESLDMPYFSANQLGKWVESCYVFSAKKEIKEMDQFYQHELLVDLVAFVDQGNLVGYTRRHRFRANLGDGPYARELLLRSGNPISKISQNNPIVLDAFTPLQDAAKILLKRSQELRYDPFFVSYHGMVVGYCSISKIIEGIGYSETKENIACQIHQKIHIPEQGSVLYPNGKINFEVQQLHGVGGDFILHHSINPSTFVAVGGDVCGKGIVASLTVDVLSTSFKIHAESWEQKFKNDFNIEDFVACLNSWQKTVFNLTAEETYATMCVMVLDGNQNVLHYFDFGHNNVHLLRGETVFTLVKKYLPGSDMSFFGMRESNVPSYTKIKVKSNDKFLFYSDGLTECRNHEMQEFGESRLRSIFAHCSGLKSKQIIPRLKLVWEDFRQDFPANDDMSIGLLTVI